MGLPYMPISWGGARGVCPGRHILLHGKKQRFEDRFPPCSIHFNVFPRSIRFFSTMFDFHHIFPCMFYSFLSGKSGSPTSVSVGGVGVSLPKDAFGLPVDTPGRPRFLKPAWPGHPLFGSRVHLLGRGICFGATGDATLGGTTRGRGHQVTHP